MLLLPDYSTMNKRGGEEKEHELLTEMQFCVLYTALLMQLQK